MNNSANECHDALAPSNNFRRTRHERQLKLIKAQVAINSERRLSGDSGYPLKTKVVTGSSECIPGITTTSDTILMTGFRQHVNRSEPSLLEGNQNTSKCEVAPPPGSVRVFPFIRTREECIKVVPTVEWTFHAPAVKTVAPSGKIGDASHHPFCNNNTSDSLSNNSKSVEKKQSLNTNDQEDMSQTICGNLSEHYNGYSKLAEMSSQASFNDNVDCSFGSSKNNDLIQRLTCANNFDSVTSANFTDDDNASLNGTQQCNFENLVGFSSSVGMDVLDGPMIVSYKETQDNIQNEYLHSVDSVSAGVFNNQHVSYENKKSQIDTVSNIISDAEDENGQFWNSSCGDELQVHLNRLRQRFAGITFDSCSSTLSSTASSDSGFRSQELSSSDWNDIVESMNSGSFVTEDQESG